MRKFKKQILIIFSVMIIIGCYFGWNIFGPVVHAPAEEYFYIPTGSNYETVIQKLESTGVLKNTTYFKLINKFRHYDQKVRAGRYKIINGMSVWHLFSMLKNARQEPVRFVINKCRTREDLAGRIGRYFETDSLEAIRFLNNADSLKTFGVDTGTVLSLIIPNTYMFVWNCNAHNILRRLKNQQNFFWENDRKPKAEKLGLTPLQVYILASIIEEETNKDEDKGKIASVYLNRIKKDMKLQADPTVKFAMRNFLLKRITGEHLPFNSPYNTYKYAGLPPGPICTPSINTIDAVLSAPATNFLYFVAKPDFSGYHLFSETYAEHQLKANAYQKALTEYLKKKETTP